MFDTYKIQETICKELEKKAENGLRNTTDLDTVWKLIDAYKNLLKIDMLQEAEEYSRDGAEGHDGGYSERRQRRDSRGRYSRSDGADHRYEGGNSYRDHGYSAARDEYMDAKHSYRSSRNPDSKRDMMASLDECKHRFREELQDMLNGADTREERDKIKEMIREIGTLA